MMNRLGLKLILTTTTLALLSVTVVRSSLAGLSAGTTTYTSIEKLSSAIDQMAPKDAVLQNDVEGSYLVSVSDAQRALNEKRQKIAGDSIKSADFKDVYQYVVAFYAQVQRRLDALKQGINALTSEYFDSKSGAVKEDLSVPLILAHANYSSLFNQYVATDVLAANLSDMAVALNRDAHDYGFTVDAAPYHVSGKGQIREDVNSRVLAIDAKVDAKEHAEKEARLKELEAEDVKRRAENAKYLAEINAREAQERKERLAIIVRLAAQEADQAPHQQYEPSNTSRNFSTL